MIFRYILIFFLRNNYGYFRSVFIVPFIGVFLGATIIFMTYSIMNSLEYEMEYRVNSFKYKYNHCEQNFIGNLNYENSGTQKISFVKNENKESVVEMYLFDNFEEYKNKISNFIKEDLQSEGVLIGDDLANFLNIQLGDSIDIFLPTDLNVSSSYIPNASYQVSSIYSFDLFDYDSRYLFIPKKIIDDLIVYDDVCYYSDELIKSYLSIENSLLLEAIKLEKKLYTGLSFMVIFICCIIIFNIMSMVMIDKQQQIYYIQILGVNDLKFNTILIAFNSFLSILSTFIGFVVANLILYLNYNFNVFSFIFSAFPFNIVPFSGHLFEYFLLYLFINLLIIFFSTLPYKILRK